MPTVSEIITANSVWEQAIVQETLRHANQPSLTEVVTNCDKRNIGSNGDLVTSPFMMTETSA